MFTKTGKPFYSKPGFASKEKCPGRMFNNILLTTKGRQNIGLIRMLLCQVSDFVQKIKLLNEKSGGISE